MTLEPEDVQGLKHYGVNGMHWGTRHKYRTAISKSVRNQNKSDYSRNKSINLSFEATKKRAKASNMELGNPNSKRAAKLRAKGDKLANESAKQRSVAKEYHKKAQSYIQEAADTGLRSFESSGRDQAKRYISAFLGSVLAGGQGASDAVGYSNESLYKKNHAAAQANRLQKRKGK